MLNFFNVSLFYQWKDDLHAYKMLHLACNNSKFFSKLFRQISNFAWIIFRLLFIALNAWLFIIFFHAFAMSTTFRHWFLRIIRNSLSRLAIVATVWGYHCFCCSKLLRQNFVSLTGRLNWMSSSYFLKCCSHYCDKKKCCSVHKNPP